MAKISVVLIVIKIFIFKVTTIWPTPQKRMVTRLCAIVENFIHLSVGGLLLFRMTEHFDNGMLMPEKKICLESLLWRIMMSEKFEINRAKKLFLLLALMIGWGAEIEKNGYFHKYEILKNLNYVKNAVVFVLADV